MIIVGDLLIGGGSRHFFDQQMKYLFSLSLIDDSIILLGNIFNDKRKVNMYQFNIFATVLHKFRNVIILLNKNDIWLNDKQDVNAVSILSHTANITVIDKPKVINGIALLPRVYSVEEQAKAYGALNFSPYSMVITNDVNGKFAVVEDNAPVYSNEKCSRSNVQHVTTFNHKLGDDELFAYRIETNEKIPNNIHPRMLRYTLEELSQSNFDFSNVEGNIVSISSNAVYNDICSRNKAINIIKSLLLSKHKALEVRIDISDSERVKQHNIKDITSYINGMSNIDSNTKMLLTNELTVKFSNF